MKNTKTKMLCEAAIFIAMAEILSLIKLYEFPNGGSVTLEMLPIILFAARYGCGWGAGAGLVYGAITYLIGNKFSIDWTTIICDYFIAFVALGFGAGLAVFMFAGFVKNIPLEIEEAAMIDGCSEMKAMWKVMIPMASPGIITVTIFNFMNIWNEYFMALIFANGNDKIRTLSMGLQNMITSMKYTGDWAGLFAGVIIVLVPTLILYLLLSEKIVAGITGGAVKG